MSQAFNENDSMVHIKESLEPKLRILPAEVTTPEFTYPNHIVGLDSKELHALDTSALMTIGALGSYRAYDAVNLWVIEPHTQTRLLRVHSELYNPQKLEVTKAAQYIAKLRLMRIVPPKVPGEEDKNAKTYMQYRFYRELDHDVQRTPQESILIKRRQAARVGIFASKLYQRMNTVVTEQT